MRAPLHYLADYEKQHTGEPSARRSRGRRQPSSGGAHLPVGEVLVRRYRRDSALPARRSTGVFLLAFVEPYLEAIAAIARTAARKRRLSADGVRRRDHRCEPARSV